MTQIPPILLLAAPRTGTSLLKALLVSDKRILNLKELLSPTPGAYNPKLGFWAKYDIATRAGIDDGRDPRARVDLFRKYLADIQKDHPGRIVLADVKYDQVGIVDTLWRMPDHTPAPISAFLEAGAAVLHLTRRNPLAQYCSLQLAMRTKVWMELEGAPNRAAPAAERTFRIEPDKILDALRRISFRNALAKLWLRDYRRVVDVEYEDLVAQDVLPDHVRQPLEEQLGVRLDLHGKPRTQKVAPPLAEMIENLDEVQTALRDTENAWCLDGDTAPGKSRRTPLPSPRRGAPTQRLPRRTNRAPTPVAESSSPPSSGRRCASLPAMRRFPASLKRAALPASGPCATSLARHLCSAATRM